MIARTFNRVLWALVLGGVAWLAARMAWAGAPLLGAILFEGQDITRLGRDTPSYRQKVGMVFQRFNLFPLKTVLENVTYAPQRLLRLPRGTAHFQGMEYLRKVGMESKADASFLFALAMGTGVSRMTFIDFLQTF